MKDYGDDGIDIQWAMVKNAEAQSDSKRRTRHILWHGKEIWTTYEVPVPEKGRLKLEFISKASEPGNGVDIDIDEGGVMLASGECVPLLRTWHEERYEDTLEYDFSSVTRVLRIWNVGKRRWPSGRTTEEKWTGNAGFWLEKQGDGALVFHCSTFAATVPDFDQFVFRLTLLPDE